MEWIPRRIPVVPDLRWMGAGHAVRRRRDRDYPQRLVIFHRVETRSATLVSRVRGARKDRSPFLPTLECGSLLPPGRYGKQCRAMVDSPQSKLRGPEAASLRRITQGKPAAALHARCKLDSGPECQQRQSAREAGRPCVLRTVRSLVGASFSLPGVIGPSRRAGWPLRWRRRRELGSAQMEGRGKLGKRGAGGINQDIAG